MNEQAITKPKLNTNEKEIDSDFSNKTNSKNNDSLNFNDKIEENNNLKDDKSFSPEKQTFYEKFVHSFDAVLQNLVEEETQPTKILSSLDLIGVANYIKEKQPKNVIFMVGAGISTSAGIPDFRTPGTGLYDNLSKFNLPNPHAIFDIDFFKTNPEPFFVLCKDLFRENVQPTVCHYLIRLFEQKGMLRRCFTQNIDTLEYSAGISEDRIVTAHGSPHTSTCQKSSCKKKYNQEWLFKHLRKDNFSIPKCEVCKSVVKPDIVFFGEKLPNRFFSTALTDFPKCDLLIIMGTSLVVQPFASLVQEVNKDVIRLLINLTAVGQESGILNNIGGSGSLKYNQKDNIRDVFWEGTCDKGALELAKLLGWENELNNLIKKNAVKTTV